MELAQDEARRRFAAARVARLATVGADGRPHLVPVTFAVRGDVLVTAVDHKPKRTARLRRLANVAATGVASVLADGYDEDWTRLWWVRVDGAAEVLPAAAEPALVGWLVGKYPQYAGTPPVGPLIRVRITAWRGWQAG